MNCMQLNRVVLCLVHFDYYYKALLGVCKMFGWKSFKFIHDDDLFLCLMQQKRILNKLTKLYMEYVVNGSNAMGEILKLG